MIALAPSAESLRLDRVHRFARLFHVARKDGANLYLTDHSSQITFGGNVYEPSGGQDVSADEHVAGASPKNAESFGVISSAKITHSDIRAGRYDEALITEYLVDWRYPFAGALLTSVYEIGSLSFDGQTWGAQLESKRRALQQIIGDVYSRQCDYDLGDPATCKFVFSAAPFIYTGPTVTAVVKPRNVYRFNIAFSTPATDWFTEGETHWTTGPNSTFRRQIEYSETSGTTVTIYLKQPVPFDIAVGHAFTIRAGCQKTFNHCKTKFNNLLNFGGFHTMPGADKMIRTPSLK